MATKAEKKEIESQKVRTRFERCMNNEKENRDLALTDIAFRNGDQWPDGVKKEREQDGRPCLTFNRSEGFIDQVTGDNRQNKIDIKISANDSSPMSDIYEAIIQKIEYRSKAKIAYNTALDHAAGHGFGFIRVGTKYLKGTFDQECEILRITNPFTVYFDPDATELTKFDAKFCFVSIYMDKEEFEDQYPKATSSPPQGEGEMYENWYGDKVRLVEYFEVRETKTEIVQLQEGTIMEYNKDIEAEQIVNRRDDVKKEIYRSLRTGFDELEEATKFPGEYLPIIPVYGKELNIEGKTIYRGVIRHARDAMQSYNFHRTASAESVALQPRAPYLATADQVEGFEDIWQTANTKNHSYLPYNHMAGQSMPSRIQPAQVSSGAVNEAGMAIEDLKATTGLYDASLGARGNETSGKAILARQAQGDNATFAYHDNLAISIEQVGRVLVSMIPEVYDGSRMMKLKKGDEEAVKPINMPSEKGVVNDLKAGGKDLDVTVTTGASYASQRIESRAALMEFAQIWPELRQVAGDKVFEAQDWDGADEIADRLRASMPPQIINPSAKPEPTPAEQAQMAEAEADMAKYEAQKATAKATTARAEADIEVASAAVETAIASEKKADADIAMAQAKEAEANLKIAELQNTEL